MFDKEFASIVKADVDALVLNQTSEDRRLDYKEQYSISNDQEKIEMLQINPLVCQSPF